MDDFPEDDFGNDDFLDEFEEAQAFSETNHDHSTQVRSFYEASPPPPHQEVERNGEELGIKRLRNPYDDNEIPMIHEDYRAEPEYGADFEVDNHFASPKEVLHDAPSLEAGVYPYPVSEGEAPPFISPNLLHFFLPNVPPTSRPVIVSVIAQANIPCGIDLRDLGCAVRTAEYLPENRIASVTLRLQHPDAVVIVRSSGALTIIGAHSVSESRQAAELGARIIRKALNLHFNTFHFRVRSITARFNACSPVRLDALALHVFKPEHSAGGVSRVLCHYEPERFNGCTIRMVGQSSLPRKATSIGVGHAIPGETRVENPAAVPPHPAASISADVSSSSIRLNRWCVSCVVYVTGKMTFLGARSQEELDFAFHAVIPIIAQYIGAGITTAKSPPKNVYQDHHTDQHRNKDNKSTMSSTSGSIHPQDIESPSSASGDYSSGGEGRSPSPPLPPSKERILSVIQGLREQWLRKRRELAGKFGLEAGEWMYENDGGGGEDCDAFLEEDMMNGGVNGYVSGGERGSGGGEDYDEDLDDEGNDDVGDGGMDDF